MLNIYGSIIKCTIENIILEPQLFWLILPLQRKTELGIFNNFIATCGRNIKNKDLNNYSPSTLSSVKDREVFKTKTKQNSTINFLPYYLPYLIIFHINSLFQFGNMNNSPSTKAISAKAFCLENFGLLLVQKTNNSVFHIQNKAAFLTLNKTTSQLVSNCRTALYSCWQNENMRLFVEQPGL